MKPNPWNPLWQSLDHARDLIPPDEVEFDPVALCSKPGITEKVDLIALRVKDRENLAPGDQYAVIKASYLLGLVIGLKRAGFSEEKLNQMVDSYKPES